MFDTNGVSFGQNNDMKPNGFWYGIDGEWRDWCEVNMPEFLGEYDYTVEVDLDKIYVIRNSIQLVAFCELYGYDNEDISGMRMIDWRKLSEKYSGIEIRNYHEIKIDLGFSFYADIGLWVSAWDVSSGCIWDIQAVIH